MRHTPLPAILVVAAALAAPACADPAEIVGVDVAARSGGYTISVTLRHGDTGWDDYADGWRIVTEGGEVVGTRVLHHPHVEEQPFTRSLSGLALPEGEALFIESSTNVTGWSGARIPLSLPPS